MAWQLRFQVWYADGSVEWRDCGNPTHTSKDFNHKNFRVKKSEVQTA